MILRRLALLLFLIAFPFSFLTYAQSEGLTVSGIVKDKSSNRKLPGVTISVPSTNIAVVTNADGSFVLKIPAGAVGNGLEAEQIGYNRTVLTAEFITTRKQPLTVFMNPVTKLLPEVTVKGGDARGIVAEAIRKIPANYSVKKSLASAFYRETVRKGNRYISVSEAIIDVFKNPYYHRNTIGDKVSLRKGRRLISQKASDTLAIKIVGGPNIPVILDIVKNEDILFSIGELDDYTFKMEGNELLDDRPQYIIKFKPAVLRDYPMNEGTLFIDHETLSITRADFRLDMRDRNKVTDMILVKKPRGLRFTPQEMSFVVTYKFNDGKSYLNYISSLTKFKCDWKRKLFSSPYVVFSELVIVDREDDPAEGISRKNAFGQRDVFYDMVENYWDPLFWNDYNIIEPTESLEKAVNKLKKSIR